MSVSEDRAEGRSGVAITLSPVRSKSRGIGGGGDRGEHMTGGLHPSAALLLCRGVVTAAPISILDWAGFAVWAVGGKEMDVWSGRLVA